MQSDRKSSDRGREHQRTQIYLVEVLQPDDVKKSRGVDRNIAGRQTWNKRQKVTCLFPPSLSIQEHLHHF